MRNQELSEILRARADAYGLPVDQYQLDLPILDGRGSDEHVAGMEVSMDEREGQLAFVPGDTPHGNKRIKVESLSDGGIHDLDELLFHHDIVFSLVAFALGRAPAVLHHLLGQQKGFSAIALYPIGHSQMLADPFLT